MVLARRVLTAGDKRLIKIDYSQWLPDGVTLVSATATDDSANTTISTPSVFASHITFFISGAVANETFTISVQVVDSLTQIKNDTINCAVIEP